MSGRFASLFHVPSCKARVTGGTRGFGLAIARRLLEQGADVTVCSRKAQACREALDGGLGWVCPVWLIDIQES